jgi:mRNA interferase MazF
VVVSRQEFLDSTYSSAVCVPVYSSFVGLPTEVPLGEKDGLKHSSAARCDEVTSLAKARLTNFVASLSTEKMRELDQALIAALDIGDRFERSDRQP